MAFVITRDPEFIKDLICGCGKSAEVAWYLPVVEKVRKLSKTDEGPYVKPEPYPYGRSCEQHIPPGLTED